jgi:8-oxo-dGTP diphosphatase
MAGRKNAAIGIIFNEDKKQVLLIKRRDTPVWVLPGGGIEADETPEQAVCREVWEETGLRVRVVRKVANYTPINSLSKPTFLFECEKVDGIPRTGCETKEISYFDLDHLPRAFFIVHQDWLQDALKHQSADPLNKPITRVTYFAFLKYFCRHPFRVIRFLLTKISF